MTTEAPLRATEAAPAPQTVQAPPRVVPLLTLRWVFLGVVTIVAFHKTLASLVQSTVDGSLNGFVWLIPIATVAAAVGIARRDRDELPIHDRQTDVIVGGLCLAFAVMLQEILLQRYAMYFHLLRIDLSALWFFVTGSVILLFGLRPVIRFRWVFMVMICMLPLFYQVAVIIFGGNRASAGAATVGIAAFATAVSTGRNRARALLGALMAAVVGIPALIAITILTPDAPLLVYQLVPATLAIVIGGAAVYFHSRRGVKKRLLDRVIEPMASRQIVAGLVVVLAAAAAIALVNLPPQNVPHTHVAGMTFGRPLAPPAGWHQVEEREFPWVRRLYGKDANLIRQRFVSDIGRPEWDKLARPRTVVVDATTTYRPFSLETYPAVVMYGEPNIRTSDPVPVDLGDGITGSLVTVVDEPRLLTHNVLSWVWRNDDAAQRVTVSSVDNHEDDVVFPEPQGDLAPMLRTMFAMFFRGNQATWDSDPTFKDRDMLTEFGRALVDAQMRRAHGSPA